MESSKGLEVTSQNKLDVDLLLFLDWNVFRLLSRAVRLPCRIRFSTLPLFPTNP